MAGIRKTPAQLQAQCDAWNKLHGIGTLIAYEDIRGEGRRIGASPPPRRKCLVATRQSFGWKGRVVALASIIAWLWRCKRHT